MKKFFIVLITIILFPFIRVTGQNQVNPKVSDTSKNQIVIPETPTEYSITSYKNVDIREINQMQLESAGLHTEIYISNTSRGVIIISSSEANKTLRDFGHILELNPTYYDTSTNQDTTIYFSKNCEKADFDFTKASSINHDYKNAFNYQLDPKTGVSWSKGTYSDFNLKGENQYGRIVYDIIIWLPKVIK